MGGWVFGLVGVWFNVLYWRYLGKEGSHRRSAGVQATGFFRANKKCCSWGCFEPPLPPPPQTGETPGELLLQTSLGQQQSTYKYKHKYRKKYRYKNIYKHTAKVTINYDWVS